MGETDADAALLARFQALLQQDPDIDELGLLFGIDAQDLTVETAFVLEEHKLGVAFSAVPRLSRAARALFHPLRQALLDDAAHVWSDAECQALHEHTRVIVLLCADHYTAWNARKELLQRGWLAADTELALCDLTLSLNPKSIDTWAHRRWIVAQYWSSLTTASMSAFCNAQLQFCQVLTERHARNYHAWSFRHWMVSRFTSIDALEQERREMQRWCEMHLTDHSGWNHRQHVLNCLCERIRIDETAEETAIARCRDVLLAELAFLSKILALYPAHEALWCHRRFVLKRVLESWPIEEDATSAQIWREMLQHVDQDAALEAEAAWSSVVAALRHARVLEAVAQECLVAWHSDTRYSQRYALWLIRALAARLDIARSPHVIAAMHALDQTFRARLAASDAVLSCLWTHAALACGQ